MSNNKITFHIQRAAKPRILESILCIVRNEEYFDATLITNSLNNEGIDIDRNSANRSLNLGVKLGIFKKADKFSYVLTPRGLSCRNFAIYRKDVYHDLIHYLMFATWEIGGGNDYWSWSYVKICEILWDSRPEKRPSRDVFGLIMDKAANEFPNLEPAAGTETVDKVVEFIRDLSPPYLVDNSSHSLHCIERDWFSVELALLAINYLYIARDVPFYTPILLDKSISKELGPLCFASFNTITTMIDTAARTFPYLTMHTGEWGTSIILQKTINLQMLN